MLLHRVIPASRHRLDGGHGRRTSLQASERSFAPTSCRLRPPAGVRPPATIVALPACGSHNASEEPTSDPSTDPRETFRVGKSLSERYDDAAFATVTSHPEPAAARRVRLHFARRLRGTSLAKPCRPRHFDSVVLSTTARAARTFPPFRSSSSRSVRLLRFRRSRCRRRKPTSSSATRASGRATRSSHAPRRSPFAESV